MKFDYITLSLICLIIAILDIKYDFVTSYSSALYGYMLGIFVCFFISQIET